MEYETDGIIGLLSQENKPIHVTENMKYAVQTQINPNIMLHNGEKAGRTKYPVFVYTKSKNVDNLSKLYNAGESNPKYNHYYQSGIRAKQNPISPPLWHPNETRSECHCQSLNNVSSYVAMTTSN